MAKRDVDEVFGSSMEFFHAFPEEKIGAPLGYGSTLYIFTYRDSIHPGLGQFPVTEGKTPTLAKLIPEYFKNFTTRVTRWKRDIAPKARLRGVMFDVCPIYAGLLPRTRQMGVYGGGMIIMGDAAGYKASAFGDGVPNAWFSGDIAADVAIEAVTSGNASASFLKTLRGTGTRAPLYHPYHLRYAQVKHAPVAEEPRRGGVQGQGPRPLGHRSLQVRRHGRTFPECNTRYGKKKPAVVMQW